MHIINVYLILSMYKNKYLIFFEDCRVVKGYQRSIIYDLTRPSNSNVIPNSLLSVIENLKSHTIDKVLKAHDKEDKEIILEYIDFLVKNEFAIIGDFYMKKHLIEFSLEESKPEIIENTIVCINDSNFANALFFLQKIQEYLCSRVELRIEHLSLTNFEKLVTSFEDSIFITVLMHSKYVNNQYNEKIEKSINKEPRIIQHIIYNSLTSVINGKSIYTKTNVDFNNDCGIIDIKNFSINRDFFISSNCGNSCLNKKLSLNLSGQICSCPSIKNGQNIDTMDIFIKSKEYSSLATLKKDEIEICSDCEYRYMCLDCRAFTDSSLRKNARPFKCNYNPYIGKWSHEEGYRTLSECGVISNEHEFSIDHDRIAKINKELWEE